MTTRNSRTYEKVMAEMAQEARKLEQEHSTKTKPDPLPFKLAPATPSDIAPLSATMIVELWKGIGEAMDQPHRSDVDIAVGRTYKLCAMAMEGHLPRGE